MHRIDSDQYNCVQPPNIRHYSAKVLVSEDRNESVNWLPAPSGEIVVAAACATDAQKAIEICRFATRQFAHLRFDHPGSNTFELLGMIADQSKHDSNITGLSMITLGIKENSVHALATGNAGFRHRVVEADEAHSPMFRNCEKHWEVLSPGASIGLFPSSGEDDVLGNSQISFLNVNLPGPLITGFVIHRKEQRDLKWQLEQLTDRERETLDLIMQGKSVKEIAADMKITIQTVSKHRGNLWEKLGVTNDVQVALRMLSSPE